MSSTIYRAVSICLALCCVRHSAEGVTLSQQTGLQCEALTGTDFSDTEDAPTQLVTAKLTQVRGTVAEYCQVEGYIAPQIGFELRLPSDWNGKFLEVGCHGYCGDVSISRNECSDPLRRGYACISTDLGHNGWAPLGLWASNNLQAKIDWGYRASHVVALAGKAITQIYYGRPAIRSYFVGSSSGGRQALVEAQRFPWDFDGIIAGKGNIDWTGAMMDMVWREVVAHGNDGMALLSAADLHTVHDAVLAKCDTDDGLRDGVITDPRACTFDPETLLCKSGGAQGGCLSKIQLEVVRKLYAGPMNSRGERIYPNDAMLPGSELAWEPWIGPAGRQYAEETFRYLGFSPETRSHWKLEDFDFDRDYKRLGGMDAQYSGIAPDLRRFKAAGGKLLVWQGWSDVPAPALSAVDYYETVERIMGGRAATQEFFRLFMIPGLGHGESEGGVDTVDYLSYLEAWVERGRPPDVMIGARVKQPVGDFSKWNALVEDPDKVLLTRPLYPYPVQAKYMGRGDPNNERNFGPFERH